MCGFAGFLTTDTNKTASCATDSLNPSEKLVMTEIATAMSDAIRHRGPNDSGVLVDIDAGIALAHRRLSILELSPAGHQPMNSANGRYVIVFNGEIYNHLDLRAEMERSHLPNPVGDGMPLTLNSSTINSGCRFKWRGHSDTETLLAGFETWGIEQMLKKTVGMFAIALWDREEETLTLVRDRMGEKPLYYGFQNKTFLFGSELKALKVHPDFLGEIDRDVLCLYLRHSYIPAPHCIYKGIQKLLPGTYLQVRLGVDTNAQVLAPVEYWSMMDVALHGQACPFQGSDAEATSTLYNQLKQSIGQQMMADVPLGAFLSGGVDSSAIVALMQSQSMCPVKTFSVGFDDVGYNEAEYAKAVAQYLGTEHTELYLSSTEAMDVIPLLGKIYDEPFADSSQIPTFLVSQMAKHHVTVSLSGDAGDELFGGYNRYLLADTWKKIERVPFPARKSAGHLIKKLSPSTWDAIFQQIGKVKKLPCNMGDKLEKLANRLEKVDGINELYYSLVSDIDCPEKVVIGASEPKDWLTQIGMNLTFRDAKQHMMFMDTMTYLPDDILVKVDRAAMANSLETRVPFLDHRVVELAWQLPMALKVREGETKWILRQVLYKHVPKELIERPKAGFGVPLGDWLRGPLREWVESLLDEQRLRREGFFNIHFVRELWCAHLTGKRNHQSLLWSILMFQIWLAEAS
jgi:asparagine synthase (glutamine-hydrolysing)